MGERKRYWGVVAEKCPKSGQRASVVLDPHYQHCPICNQRCWITLGGYFPAHARMDK